MGSPPEICMVFGVSAADALAANEAAIDPSAT